MPDPVSDDPSLPTAPGVTVANYMGLGAAETLRAARLADDLGYGSFWTAEIVGPEAFALLAAAGGAAPNLALGSGIIAIQVRSPLLAAMGAATLQDLYPDRPVLLGVGISSPVVTSRWHGVPYGDRPLARMREYVALVRELLTGEPVTFAGDFYQVTKVRISLPHTPRRPAIVVAALNEGMLRLAGEVADGVVLNYQSPELVPWSVAQVRAGAAKRSDGGEPTVYCNAHVAVTDRDAGLDEARADLFSYAVVDAYAATFERAGFGAEIEMLRAAHRAGDRAGALAAISDAMVDAHNVMGDAAHVRRTVTAYQDAGTVPVVMPLPFGGDPATVLTDTLRAAVGKG